MGRRQSSVVVTFISFSDIPRLFCRNGAQAQTDKKKGWHETATRLSDGAVNIIFTNTTSNDKLKLDNAKFFSIIKIPLLDV